MSNLFGSKLNHTQMCFLIVPSGDPDITAIFSIASCASTWETFEHVRKERLLLMAITDPDCPRLPLHEALTVIHYQSSTSILFAIFLVIFFYSDTTY